WSTSTLPSGAPRPIITASGANATAVFGVAGSYGLSVQGTASGVSVIAAAPIVVNPVLSFVTLTTAAANSVAVNAATTQLTVNQFLDQFHNALSTQPTLTWSATTVPSGAQPPAFSINGKTVTVTFHKAGN